LSYFFINSVQADQKYNSADVGTRWLKNKTTNGITKPKGSSTPKGTAPKARGIKGPKSPKASGKGKGHMTSAPSAVPLVVPLVVPSIAPSVVPYQKPISKAKA
jgi:hypothetical protein